MTYNPTDLAVPELITILTPSRLARISVTRRPSIKLKMTPHIHPSDNPFRNMAATLNGVESNPNKISEDSASNTEVRINLNRSSGFNSEISLIPMNLEITYPSICEIVTTTL